MSVKLILEKIDTLIASINAAHHAKDQVWKQGCFDAADSTYEQIKEMLVAAQNSAIDTGRLDWLALAGPVSICLVIDREHDGEIEVSTDNATWYGKTLREAIDNASTTQKGS